MTTGSLEQQAEEEIYKTFVQELQHDVNCLSSETKQTRLLALKRLVKTLALSSKTSLFTLQKLCTEHDAFRFQLAKVFSDPVDSCRETALTIIHNLVEVIGNGVAPQVWLGWIIPGSVSRLTTEPKEEVKLSFIQLLQRTLALCTSQDDNTLLPFMPDIISILKLCSGDPFDELKRESCVCIVVLLEHSSPGIIIPHVATLLKAVVPNLTYYKNPVRQASLEVVRMLVLLSGTIYIEDLIPHLMALTIDKSNKVKELLIRSVTDWLRLPSICQEDTQFILLIILLTGIFDPFPSVQSLTLLSLESLGQSYAVDHPAETQEAQQYETSFHDTSYLPPLFNGRRPSLGARLLIRKCLQRMILVITKDITDWTAKNRVRAAQLLHSVILYSEEHITSYLPKILDTLIAACGDEDPTISSTIITCAKLLGKFVSPDAYLIYTSPIIREQTLSSTLHKANTIHTLSFMMSTAPPTQLLEKVPNFIESLSYLDATHDSSETDFIRVKFQMLNVVDAIVQCLKEQCSSVRFNLFSLLLQLKTTLVDSAIIGKCIQVMQNLSAACSNNLHELYDEFVPLLLKNSVTNYVNWTNQTIECLMFHEVLRNASSKVGNYLQDITTITVELTSKKKDATVRTAALATLNNLLLRNDWKTAILHWNATVGVLLKEVVLPSMQWQAGRATVAVRKEAISCLHSMMSLQARYSDFQMLVTLTPSIPETLSTLLTALDEEDSTSRIIMCKIFGYIVELLHTVLTEPHMRLIYSALSKKLDDIEDAVRIEAAAVIRAYLERKPPGSETEEFTSILKSLFIHLDDQNPSLQAEVFKTLETASPLHPQKVLELASAQRDRHRSPHYCDKLIAHINQTMNR